MSSAGSQRSYSLGHRIDPIARVRVDHEHDRGPCWPFIADYANTVAVRFFSSFFGGARVFVVLDSVLDRSERTIASAFFSGICDVVENSGRPGVLYRRTSRGTRASPLFHSVARKHTNHYCFRKGLQMSDGYSLLNLPMFVAFV